MKAILKVVSITLAALMLASCAAPGASSQPEQPLETAVPETPAPTQAPLGAGLAPAPEGISPVTGRAVRFPGQRPVAVMLYNTPECRPQWGIGSADMLIEAGTEGQNSRLMAVFEGWEGVEKAGPVGPARDLFLQMVMPFGAIPMFNGSDVYSSNLLNKFSYQPLDGHYAGVSAFDYELSRRGIYASEYGWYTHKDLIPGALALYGQSPEGKTPSFFNFAEGSAPQNGNGRTLEVGYGTSRQLQLVYDGESHYEMFEGGQPQADEKKPEEPARFKNVVLILAKPGLKDDKVTQEYTLTEGRGLYLCQGGAKPIRWQKGGAQMPLRLLEETGEALYIEPGRTYLGIWGGQEGQSLKLLGQDGAEQPLPELPAADPAPTPEAQPAPEGEPAPEPQPAPEAEPAPAAGA